MKCIIALLSLVILFSSCENRAPVSSHQDSNSITQLSVQQLSFQNMNTEVPAKYTLSGSAAYSPNYELNSNNQHISGAVLQISQQKEIELSSEEAARFLHAQSIDCVYCNQDDYAKTMTIGDLSFALDKVLITPDNKENVIFGFTAETAIDGKIISISIEYSDDMDVAEIEEIFLDAIVSFSK